MKKMLSLALVMVMFSAVGCISVHNNKQATAATHAIANPAEYKAITKLGEKPVTAEVTAHSIVLPMMPISVFSWGMPNTFADRGAISGEVSFADPYAEIKKATSNIACQNAKCDSLLDAKYTITNENYLIYSKITCVVTGIPVFVTGYELTK